jgi:hypothetical protein
MLYKENRISKAVIGADEGQALPMVLELPIS